MTGFQFRAASGLGIALLAGRLAQAAAFFVMARVLDEANMGVVSILTIIYTALFQLTNFGFERYIVYNELEDEESLTAAINAVWSLQLIRTVIILIATAALSLFFEGSEHYSLGYAHLTAIGLAAMLMSSISPDLSTHERSGNFAYFARARGYSALIGAAATIAVVLVWANPWAFVVGQVVTSAIFMALSFIYSSRMPRVSFSSADIRKVFSYCKHLLVIAVVSFMSTQVQNIYVGAMFSPAVLGSYFTWYRLVNLPRELVTQYTTQLLFAKASADSRSGGDLMASHLRGFAFTVVALVPFHVFVWFHGDFLITFVAGERWASFWWGGRLMAVASILLALSATIGPYNLVHLPHISSKLRTGEAVTMTLLMAMIGGPFGLRGVLYSVIVVMAVAMLLRVYLLYTQFVTQNRWGHARTMTLILVVTAAPLALVEAIVRLYLPRIDAVDLGRCDLSCRQCCIVCLHLAPRRQADQGHQMTRILYVLPELTTHLTTAAQVRAGALLPLLAEQTDLMVLTFSGAGDSSVGVEGLPNERIFRVPRTNISAASLALGTVWRAPRVSPF